MQEIDKNVVNRIKMRVILLEKKNLSNREFSEDKIRREIKAIIREETKCYLSR